MDEPTLCSEQKQQESKIAEVQFQRRSCDQRDASLFIQTDIFSLAKLIKYHPFVVACSIWCFTLTLKCAAVVIYKH